MSLLGIGISGLNVSQTSLQVTGNNIANANNPGYSRQRIEQATLPEQLRGPGYVGAGAAIEDISRVVDEFLVKQIQLDTANFNSLEVAASNLAQIDGLLADNFSSLGPAISNFYAALAESAQDPASEPARQVVLSQAESLTQTLNTLASRVNQQTAVVNQQVSSLTAQVSSLATGLAQLNIKIGDEVARGSNGEPNQLLDQREELLRQISELVSVTVVENDNALDLYVGNGQPLVIGGTAASLSVAPSATSQGNLDVTYVDQNGDAQTITRFINGGKIGGLLEFRDDTAGEVTNSLGLIALGIADTLNQQNALGIDLDGDIGGDIFSDINAPGVMSQRVRIDAGNSNPTAQSMSVAITDVGQLNSSDYLLNVVDSDGSAPLDYQLIRLSDSSSTFINGTAGAQSLVVDGFSIDIPAATQSNLALGDKFYIAPTRSGAVDIAVTMNRVEDLAYAVPVVTDARIGNTGDGSISAGQMLSIVDDSDITFAPANPLYSAPGKLAGEVLIRFDSATDYTVYENSNQTSPEVLFSGSIIPGQRNSIFDTAPGDPNYIGFQVEIDGIPAAGDEFSIRLNSSGSSDNRNAINLGETRNLKALDGGTVNFENAYGSLIEAVGTQTAQAQISRDASESLLLQSQASRDSLSGVNLDEEAANLIKFEQSYNASAQIINIARQIFDTLLSAVR